MGPIPTPSPYTRNYLRYAVEMQDKKTCDLQMFILNYHMAKKYRRLKYHFPYFRFSLNSEWLI